MANPASALAGLAGNADAAALNYDHNPTIVSLAFQEAAVALRLN
ncbi:MAG: hypothetical protein WA702_20410 [Bradyrhizobium sp.]|jgi:hypothetical protein